MKNENGIAIIGPTRWFAFGKLRIVWGPKRNPKITKVECIEDTYYEIHIKLER